MSEQKLREALQAAQVALEDWMNVYAADMCDEKRVAEAKERIKQYGTIGYIANTLGLIHEAISQPQTSDDTLEQPRAATELADAKAELKKHLSSSVDYDLVDGIRQLAQAAISWKENCETLERQLVTNGKVVEMVTTTNTGTPITDYAAYYVSEEAHRLIFGEGGELCGEVVNAEVSRRLERENSELRERLNERGGGCG